LHYHPRNRGSERVACHFQFLRCGSQRQRNLLIPAMRDRISCNFSCVIVTKVSGLVNVAILSTTIGRSCDAPFIFWYATRQLRSCCRFIRNIPMRRCLFLFIGIIFFIQAKACFKVSSIFYNLPDSIKAVLLKAEILVCHENAYPLVKEA
jgi:hypothetical protein